MRCSCRYVYVYHIEYCCWVGENWQIQIFRYKLFASEARTNRTKLISFASFRVSVDMKNCESNGCMLCYVCSVMFYGVSIGNIQRQMSLLVLYYHCSHYMIVLWESCTIKYKTHVIGWQMKNFLLYLHRFLYLFSLSFSHNQSNNKSNNNQQSQKKEFYFYSFNHSTQLLRP